MCCSRLLSSSVALSSSGAGHLTGPVLALLTFLPSRGLGALKVLFVMARSTGGAAGACASAIVSVHLILKS